MVQVKVLRSFSADGMKREGTTVDVPEQRARQWVRKGYVAYTTVGAGSAKTKGADPTKAPRSGGKTGEAKAASSSPEAPAPRKRTSRKRKEKPAS